MKIAFVTTCKRRAFHIKLTLPRNLADNADPNSIFILVDYSSPDDLLEFVAQINDPRLHVYSYAHEGPFRIAHAKNLAHRLGIEHGADILVNLDADNLTGKDFDRYIARMFETYGPETFLWARMVVRCNQFLNDDRCVLPRKHSEPCTTDAETLEWLHPNENERPKVRGVAGRLVVPKEAFLRAGGYDEVKFPTWGPDDVDFNRRIQRLGFVPREIAGRFVNAVHHSEQVRFREYPHVKSMSDSASRELEALIAADPHTAVVNSGKVGCGHVVRLRDGVALSVEPYPTRIFGIGFGKTGTTSLHQALQLLGYDAAHWLTPRWARDVWEQVRAHGHSLALEQFDALTDFPFALLYRELDAAYPGSKFILTLRDEDEWLRSVEHHFGPENPWRSTWDNDAFTHRLHREAYGRKTFEAQPFRTRYQQHNAQVREYFKGRNCLLELDLKDAGWPALCGFLGKPEPAVPYPHANVY